MPGDLSLRQEGGRVAGHMEVLLRDVIFSTAQAELVANHF